MWAHLLDNMEAGSRHRRARDEASNVKEHVKRLERIVQQRKEERTKEAWARTAQKQQKKHNKHLAAKEKELEVARHKLAAAEEAAKAPLPPVVHRPRDAADMMRLYLSGVMLRDFQGEALAGKRDISNLLAILCGVGSQGVARAAARVREARNRWQHERMGRCSAEQLKEAKEAVGDLLQLLLQSHAGDRPTGSGDATKWEAELEGWAGPIDDAHLRELVETQAKWLELS